MIEYFDLNNSYPNLNELPINLCSVEAHLLPNFIDENGEHYKLRENIAFLCFRALTYLTEYYDAHDGSFVKTINSQNDEIDNLKRYC